MNPLESRGRAIRTLIESYSKLRPAHDQSAMALLKSLHGSVEQEVPRCLHELRHEVLRVVRFATGISAEARFRYEKAVGDTFDTADREGETGEEIALEIAELEKQFRLAPAGSPRQRQVLRLARLKYAELSRIFKRLGYAKSLIGPALKELGRVVEGIQSVLPRVESLEQNLAQTRDDIRRTICRGYSIRVATYVVTLFLAFLMDYLAMLLEIAARTWIQRWFPLFPPFTSRAAEAVALISITARLTPGLWLTLPLAWIARGTSSGWYHGLALALTVGLQMWCLNPLSERLVSGLCLKNYDHTMESLQAFLANIEGLERELAEGEGAIRRLGSEAANGPRAS